MERNEAGRIWKNKRCLSFHKQVSYRLYFKGLVVSNEFAAAKGGESNTTTAGFGVAICDPTDKLLFEMRESVSDSEINREGAEIRALICGLTQAFDLGIVFIVVYCEDDQIYQYVSGKCKPKEKEVIELMEQVHRLKEKFACGSTLVAPDNNKIAFRLASEAIGSRTDDEKLTCHGDDGHDHDHYDEEDDNPWAYGCGCDFDIPDSPPGFDVDAYIEYYSL